MTEKLQVAIEASLAAGRAIMQIYQQEDFEVVNKNDNSPLTLADKKANDIINTYLLPSEIPVISEENKQVDYLERKKWNRCWIVDPLDGTKEFLKRNGEFTVNIAFVENGKPALGVIFAPALGDLYFALVSESKAWKYKLTEEDWDIQRILQDARQIKAAKPEGQIKVVGSRSHMNDSTREFLNELKKLYGNNVEVVSKGSSLKFCLVAEGMAHIYPRFAPTMEWDTAAGQAICEAVGLRCILRETGEQMTYNREDLLNNHFYVSYEG